MQQSARYYPAGDTAIVVELGDSISPNVNRRVRDLTAAIDRVGVAGVFDVVPTYRSVLVYYDSRKTSYASLVSNLRDLEGSAKRIPLRNPRLVHIPVYYGEEYGPDIEFVADNAGVSVPEVVNLHSGTDYLIYMMGFAPGFPYLGGLSQTLHTARLTTPRTEIPAGTVGIAESQTGIYPVSSPGGWQLIGRTPIKMFDPLKDPPSLLTAGDFLRFVPIDSATEFDRIHEMDQEGEYQPTVTEVT